MPALLPGGKPARTGPAAKVASFRAFSLPVGLVKPWGWALGLTGRRVPLQSVSTFRSRRIRWQDARNSSARHRQLSGQGRFSWRTGGRRRRARLFPCADDSPSAWRRCAGVSDLIGRPGGRWCHEARLFGLARSCRLPPSRRHRGRGSCLGRAQAQCQLSETVRQAGQPAWPAGDTGSPALGVAISRLVRVSMPTPRRSSGCRMPTLAPWS